MALPFPSDEPFLRGYYAPLLAECDADNLPVSGELPKDLNGWLYRNGPNPQFAPRGPYHWFAGDGMLHAFHVENGRVAYRNRWVRTPKWELEHAEREGLSGAFGNPRYSDPRIVELGSTLANTNVVWHGGRLLALEEAHAPFEVDPVTLASKGSWNYGGRLAGPMTAHPKIDADGEMVFFGYAATGRYTPEVALHVADKDGRLVRSDMLAAPFPSMVHDFVVTRDWIVLPIFPLTGSMERAQTGRPPYAWEPELGTHVALIPRRGSVADARWFRGDPSYVFHPMNAYDTPDGKVVCDMMQYPVAPLFPLPDGRPSTDAPPSACLVRWTLDPNGGTERYDEQPLDDHPGEFPRLDERYTGRPYRHGYFQAGAVTDAEGRLASRSGIAHIDHASGRVALWRPGPEDRCGEPIFVPRRPDAAEGDGYLLSVIFRAETQCSDLAVFDATDVAAGPIALAHLSHRVPAGFHGNWRNAG
ncbi:MAG: carotenoid oxygenase family protein [Proteobacteria bacterium]|nr:carotenoid oxygenase family protein [Pseudomonadota bacterium]